MSRFAWICSATRWNRSAPSIRETQRSTRQLKQVDLLPVSEALLDAAAISRFRSGYLEAFGAPGDDPLYATVSEGGRRAGMEHWLPLFYERLETLLRLSAAEAC